MIASFRLVGTMGLVSLFFGSSGRGTKDWTSGLVRQIYKSTRVGRLALFGAGFLGMACYQSMALANAVTLVCDTHVPPPVVDLGPATIELNEADGTATVTWPAYEIPSVGTRNPARTGGPFHATFSPNTITFTGAVTFAGTTVSHIDSYEINRITGEVDIAPDDPKSYHPHWTCHVGQKQF